MSKRGDGGALWEGRAPAAFASYMSSYTTYAVPRVSFVLPLQRGRQVVRDGSGRRAAPATHTLICRMAPYLPKMSNISSGVMLKGRFLEEALGGRWARAHKSATRTRRSLRERATQRTSRRECGSPLAADEPAESGQKAAPGRGSAASTHVAISRPAARGKRPNVHRAARCSARSAKQRVRFACCRPVVTNAIYRGFAPGVPPAAPVPPLPGHAAS